MRRRWRRHDDAAEDGAGGSKAARGGRGCPEATGLAGRRRQQQGENTRAAGAHRVDVGDASRSNCVRVDMIVEGAVIGGGFKGAWREFGRAIRGLGKGGAVPFGLHVTLSSSTSCRREKGFCPSKGAVWCLQVGYNDEGGNTERVMCVRECVVFRARATTKSTEKHASFGTKAEKQTAAARHVGDFFLQRGGRGAKEQDMPLTPCRRRPAGRPRAPTTGARARARTGCQRARR